MAGRQTDSEATTGYQAELWQMADALRGSMDAAEYKHVVLGAMAAIERDSLALKEVLRFLAHQQAEGARLDAAIARNPEMLGFGGGR